MATQRYDFTNGVESAAAPTPSAPSAIGDVAPIGATTTFTIANSQAATNITGMVFSKTSIRSFLVWITIFRSAAGGSTRAQAMLLMGVTDGTNWEISGSPMVACPNTDDAGVDFTITSSGQVQYASDDNGGAYDAATSILDWEILQLCAV